MDGIVGDRPHRHMVRYESLKHVLIDIVIGVALALWIAALVLLASFNSTFIYQGF